jgi:amidohydrolase
MLKLRRELHQHPELSRQEQQTSARVQQLLNEAGITDITLIEGTTGFVATLHGEKPGRTIALRADMDALPIQEETKLPFASQYPGIMHACGHDAHTAILYGAAITLQQQRENLCGTVHCIFQHAEELEPTGARDFIKAGVLDDVDAVLGWHVEPSLPVGVIGGLHAGPRNAASDQFTITISGTSAHGAWPERGVDAVAVAASVIQELQKISSRLTLAQDPVVVTIGSIHGGTAPNILADKVVMQGILRTMKPETRNKVSKHLEEIARGIAKLYAASAEVLITRGEPSICNDEGLTTLVRSCAEKMVGKENATNDPPASMGADDFAFYLEHVPGMMFRLGVRNEATDAVYPVHHPRFAIDEAALSVGASLVVASVLEFTRGAI